MSTDTAKEIVSIVDSSLSQKYDVGNFEEPESSSCRANDDKKTTRTEEEGQKDLVNNSNVVKKDKEYNMRYFIIKSLNHENIQLSVEKGIWATQVMNEPILEEAFHKTSKVILIFSVNSSGFFQGYAQMMSSVGHRRDNVWTQGTGPNNPWGRSFRVKWLRLSNLSFHKTLHLKNPLNEYKPVKISRDCQELSPEIGDELCQLIDRESEVDPCFKRDTYLTGMHGVDSGYGFPDDVYPTPPVDMTWASKSMLYPSYYYQYYTEASGSLVASHGSVGVFPSESLPIMKSKGSLTRHSHRKGKTLGSPSDHKLSSQADGRQMSCELTSISSTLSEDDFLEMSYEEYLEAHSKGMKQDGNKSRKKDSSSKELDHDVDLKVERGNSRKRSRH